MSEKHEENAKTLALKAGKGGVIPPKEKQFGQPNGNKQGHGFFKKEDTPRYKLEQMMKFSEAELRGIEDDPERPYFERKLAKAIIKGEWQEIEHMINQVYGMPKEKKEVDLSGEVSGITITVKKYNKEGNGA